MLLKKTMLFSWVIVVSITFILFAYPIFELNTKLRVLLTTGEFSHRFFDSDGFPISRSADMGEFRSPFYIVHYGLQYSDYIKKKKPEYRGLHWREDPSQAKWNVPRDKSEEPSFERYFYSAADWLVKNIDTRFGPAHYLYAFNWPYKGYPTNELKAPWWSGLTDGYAILLLLRAYDHFDEARFLDAASNLYQSVTLEIEKGGSWSQLKGAPWIEEYVDPRFSADEMSYVLNGMIYATYGVEAFEAFFASNKGVTESLYRSIFDNVSRFDLNHWSSYDLIGTANSIKYHLIHVALLEDLNKRFPELATEATLKLEEDWRRTSMLPGFYYLVYGSKTVAYFHFAVTYLLLVLLPFFLLRATVRYTTDKKTLNSK